MAWQDRLVYTTGMMRSGTTLLQSLLDGHKELLFYPEEASFVRYERRAHHSRDQLINDLVYGTSNPLHLSFELEEAGGYPDGFDRKGESSFPADYEVSPEMRRRALSVYKCRGFSERDLEGEFDVEKYFSVLFDALEKDTTLCERQAILHTMEAYKQALSYDQQCKMWGFKTLVNFRNMDAAWARFREMFPKLKILLIIRDPRGQFNSAKKYHINRQATHKTVPFYHFPELYRLRKSYEALLRVIKDPGPYSLMPVFYEDLACFPEKVMKEVAEFLGISFDPVLVTPSRFGVTREVVTGREDYKAEITVQSLEAWRTELSPAEIRDVEMFTSGFMESALTPYQKVENDREGALAGHCLKQALTAHLPSLMRYGVRRVKRCF